LPHNVPVPDSFAGERTAIAARDRLLWLRQAHELFRPSYRNTEQRRSSVTAFRDRSLFLQILDGELATRRANLLEPIAAGAVGALAPEGYTRIRHGEDLPQAGSREVARV
jgi:hypothetical protein